MCSEEYVEVRIPRSLYERAQQFIKETGEFRSVDEFVKFVLEQVLGEEEQRPTYTPEEEEKIRERLRALGYL